MKRNFAIFIIAICLAAGILIAGCTQPSSPAQPVTNSGAAAATQMSLSVKPTIVNPATNMGAAVSTQTSLTVNSSMANPASVNCGKLGGATDIRKNADGSEYGMCTFSNGTSCEEWALYRAEGCKPTISKSK